MGVKLNFLFLRVFPATPLRSAAGRYVPGSAIAPATAASPAVAACGALHIANTELIHLFVDKLSTVRFPSLE